MVFYCKANITNKVELVETNYTNIERSAQFGLNINL